MNDNDKQVFSDLIDAMASAFRKEASKAMKHGYWLGLLDLTIEQVETAIGNAIRQHKYMPSVADLREYAGIPGPEEIVALAFQALDHATDRYEPVDTVSFDDPVLNATVRNLGGWPAIFRQAPNFQTFFRKRFEDTYKMFFKKELNSEQVKPLPGTHGKQVIHIKSNVPGIEQIAITQIPDEPVISTLASSLTLKHPITNLKKNF